MNIGIMASGNLGFTTCSTLLDQGLRPVFLFTDKGSVALQQLFGKSGIPVFVGNPRQERGLAFLQQLGPHVDLIFSINYLFVIEQDIIQFPSLGCLNIHGSLLPRYRGRTPHVWSIINNEKNTGITVHYIDQGCDTGAVVAQEIVEISPDATGGSLLKIFEKRYPMLVVKVLAMFQTGKPDGIKQNERCATYFGKRSPDDGRINWDWQKERIHNWIRSQADPYPGAFCFYKGEKIIIDLICDSDTGYSWEMPNGLILQGGDQPEIKTPNGAIKILSQRNNVLFNEGDVLL